MLRPGFATIEQSSDTPAVQRPSGGGFDGLSDVEASALWEAAHLCLRCVHQHVCKWATTSEAPIVIARCLSFVARDGASVDTADSRGA